MNRDREYDFLLHITRRRFLEILEAFARSVGIDEAVVKQIPTLDLTDTKAFSRILASPRKRNCAPAVSCTQVKRLTTKSTLTSSRIVRKVTGH